MIRGDRVLLTTLPDRAVFAKRPKRLQYFQVSDNGGLKEKSRPAAGGLLFLSDVAGPLRQKPMEISVAIWGGALASTRGIAEHAWYANRRGRVSRTHVARRGTPPPIVGNGAGPPPLRSCRCARRPPPRLCGEWSTSWYWEEVNRPLAMLAVPTAR